MGCYFSSEPENKLPEIVRCHNHKRPDELPSNWQARVDLATACRGFYFYGIGLRNAMFNHAVAVAKRKDGTGSCYLLGPFGVLWKDVTPESIVEIDLSQGDKAWESLNGMPDTAVHIMIALQKNRPDCIAVFHCHPTYSLSLACTKNAKIEQLNMTFMELCQDIGYYGSKVEDWETYYNDWFQTLGENKHVLWLANHGVTTIGHSVAQAFEKMTAMEQAAEAQVKAMSTGQPLRLLAPERTKQLIELLQDDYPDHAQAHLDSFRNLLPENCRKCDA